MRHGHLSQGTQDRITAKVSKLSRFYDRITAVNVTVDLKREDAPEVEIRVSAELAEDFVARDSAVNVIGAVESAVQKLEKQLRKHKQKMTDHRNLGRRVNAELADQDVPSDDNELVEEGEAEQNEEV
ncbi:MAG: ribosome-associated translation inhibitor RaiA [Planctomycetales bacterium]|nr:ribosome-associated translation inhibitor RaiA [Planctomycetales bacterium]